MKQLRLLWELNPKRKAEKVGRFLAGQKLKRKYDAEYAALLREKPVYKPINTQL